MSVFSWKALRGFTLVELATAIAVSGIAITMVVMIVITQQRAFQSAEMQRSSSEAGRDALFELERSLRRAGFGVDPRFAFDFRSYQCPSAEQISGVGGRTTCRDRTTASDRLVFVARNPAYRIDANGENGCATSTGCATGQAWAITARSSLAVAPTVSFVLRANQKLYRGQTLLIACAGGSRYTMSTVMTKVEVSSPSNVTVRLYPTVSTNPYFENAYTDTCFESGAFAFAVDRFSYSVRSLGGVPWLVLDPGLDIDDDSVDPWTTLDEDDLLPVAPYIEDVQVAYVYDRSSRRAAGDSDANYVTSDDKTTNLPEEPNPEVTNPPLYDTPTDDDRRGTLHPGNVRAVRVSLSLRSERQDLSAGRGPAQAPDAGPSTRWEGDLIPTPENSRRQLTTAELGYYRRQSVMSTVAVRNLGSRGMFTF